VDSSLADRFAATCERALEAHPDRLELDLSGVAAIGASGVDVIAWCLSVGRHLARGIGVSVATTAGRRALLAATDRV
jgi:anti-anti-sigma regulatory factor